LIVDGSPRIRHSAERARRCDPRLGLGKALCDEVLLEQPQVLSQLVVDVGLRQ
jgi:hypothetical protein